jgi:uroporphyrin-III C-methyltransferase / precorrin-2 dehydrogenase / sirohydrochlorin ferrochelatase
MSYYPVYLDLRGRRCVVLGGGATALEKVRGLLDAGANVTVVATDPTEEIAVLAGDDRLSLVRREYRIGDLAGAFLAIDASWDEATNRASSTEAERAQVLINVVDRPRQCSFIAPAVVRRDPLQVAISTSGESPFLASALRARIERTLGEEWGAFTAIVGRIRRQLRERGTPLAEQNRVYRKLMASDVRRLLRRGRHEEAAFAAAAIASAAGQVKVGRVALVGAGPGDPQLLTLAARDLLAEADVVYHDALVHPETLRLCGPQTRQVDVGKRAGQPHISQEGITRQMIESARAGLDVVRLKGGDPFIFGRGGEEMAELMAEGIQVLVVPGVTAAVAAPAVAGIPLTMRGVASSVAFVTGHSGGDGASPAAIGEIARAVDTLVVLMPMGNLGELAARLAAALGGDHPAAVVSNATLDAEQVVRAPLRAIGDAVRQAGLAAPALLVVGHVVAAIGEATQRDEASAGISPA